MPKPLHIAITADPEIPVPPQHYGGIERIIDLLINGLTEQGHQVSLFAHPGSETPAKLYPFPGKSSRSKTDIIQNSWLINKTAFLEKFDLIHSFGRLMYLLPQLPLSIPKLMTYQREPTLGQIKQATRLAKKGTLAFTGCSHYISSQIEPYAPSYTVYNGVDTTLYSFQETVSADAPLVFLGRIEPIKGTHTAIEVAQQTNKKLIIAGNISPGYQEYFEEKVKPFLNDHIQYIGPVNDQQKNELLGASSALLMPIHWNEPFGIVMAEAMACGTPVVGFKRGAVKEIIIDGVNGYSCDTTDEMTRHVSMIGKLDRRRVRQNAEDRFSAPVIVEQYLSIYYKFTSDALSF